MPKQSIGGGTTSKTLTERVGKDEFDDDLSPTKQKRAGKVRVGLATNIHVTQQSLMMPPLKCALAGLVWPHIEMCCTRQHPSDEEEPQEKERVPYSQ